MSVNSLKGPRIAHHGGGCCGIKIIHGLGEYPTSLAPELAANTLDNKKYDADQYGYAVRSDWNIFPGSAPTESYADRIERYLKWLDGPTGRPHGIVEIALAKEGDGKYDDNQIKPWAEYLKKWGFKEVTSCYNSNSGNRVHVYHRVTDK